MASTLLRAVVPIKAGGIGPNPPVANEVSFRPREEPRGRRTGDGSSPAGRLTSALVVGSCDQAPGGGAKFQSLKEVAAHPEPVRIVNGSALRQVKAIIAPNEDPGENILLVAHLFPDRIGKLRVAIARRTRIQHAYKPQFVRPLHGEHPEHDRIDQAEDRRVGSNANSERDDGDGGESEIFRQHAHTEANILKQRLNEAHAPGVPAFFFSLSDAAKLAESGIASFLRAHPRRDVLVDRIFQMKL